MITALTVFTMLAVAYAYFREGLFTAFTMCCNVFIAGLVAFNFFEPLANLLEPPMQGGIMAGYEDALCLFVLFAVTLGLLRLIANNLANAVVDYHPVPQQIGGALVGAVTGYLTAGFMICMLQTLPWHENFLGFEPKDKNDPPLRRVFPPDRLWLSLMRWAGAYPLANQTDPLVPNPSPDNYEIDSHVTFDKYGTFEIRYIRYRRYGDARNPVRYQGELDKELHRLKR